MTTPLDYSTWYSKQAAADLIGVSTKSIENFAAQSKIASALWRDPAGGPQKRVYAPEDVQRLAAARQDAGSPQFGFGPNVPPHLTPFLSPQPATVGLAIPANGAPASGLGNFLETFALSQKELATKLGEKTASEKLASKLFLTIKEAAELSGLSQAYIHRACVETRLDAIRDGQVWKIRRAALAAL